MLTTPRRGIQYPDPTTKTDRADIAQHITNCAVLLDVDVLYQEGTDAARIAATHQGGGGLFWFATDTAQLWYDDGSAWHGPFGVPGAGSIINSMLAPNSVASSNIIDGTIQNVDLGPDCVSSANIINGTIQTADLADGCVTSAKIADGTITAADLAPGAITPGSLPPGIGTSIGNVLPVSGLFTGYQFTLLWNDGVYNRFWNLVYRPDLDASYPWFYFGGGKSIVPMPTPAANAAKGNWSGNSAAIVTPPKPGVYKVGLRALVSSIPTCGMFLALNGGGLTTAISDAPTSVFVACDASGSGYNSSVNVYVTVYYLQVYVEKEVFLNGTAIYAQHMEKWDDTNGQRYVISGGHMYLEPVKLAP